jgi:hypothetical protein
MNEYRSCLLKEEQLVEISPFPTSCKIILESMTDNVVITELDVLINVVLSGAEKHVIYEELVGTTKAQRYRRDVAKSERVVTEFNCI